MKKVFNLICLVYLSLFAQQVSAQNSSPEITQRRLYIDVHQLEPGKVSFDDVAKAHLKDLAVGPKYGADFLKFWVDKKDGKVYCLSSAVSPEAITKTHAEAHGLLPQQIYEVTDGKQSPENSKQSYFLDVHEFGAGKVNADAVAGAHAKDLAVGPKYGVNFINYWVDEKAGVVMCLAQAKDSASMVNAHKEAHGLIPVSVMKVQQGK